MQIENNKKLPLSWNLSPLGKSYQDPVFQKERVAQEKAIKKFAKKWKKDNSYLTQASSLKKALQEFNAILEMPQKESMYLFLMRQIDSGNTKLISAENRHNDWGQTLSDEIRFFTLSLGKIEKKYQKIFLKDKNLLPYRHYLDGIFATAKYQLSEKEEKILSLKSGVASGNWSSMISEIFAQEKEEVLIKGEKGKRLKREKTFHEILALLQSDCKRVRNSAAKAVEKILARNAFVVEKEFNAILENKKINDKLRGYKRADEARVISDDISLELVDSMTSAVSDAFKISRDFYKLKSKLLKQEKLHYHERNIPLFKNKKEYSYEEAVSLVESAFAQRDEDFVSIFKEMVSLGRVDVFPKQGKRGGAFCMYYGKQEPVYVMLNHTNKTNDVMTLAHEMGHAIHGTLSKKEIGLYYDTPMFMAETASTFCEGLVFEKIINEASDREKLALYMEKIGDTVSTIMRQIAAYNFEREIHETFREKAYLSKENIGKIFKKHMSSYMGPAVLQDYGAENWWMYWSHFRSPFYVYSYASGLLMANGMHALVKEDPEKWNQVKQFFYTGTSKSPEQVFKEIGIDIKQKTFWENGLKEVETILKETKKLAKKLGKI